jgi:hypothetical protein
MTGIMQMVANNVQPAVSALIQLLYLDPGNSSSYPGSGTTWTDLSGNTNNATLNGSPTWTNAGTASYFSFNGTGSQNATTASAKYVQTYTGKTVIVAIRPSTSAWTPGVDQFRGIFGTAAGSRNFNTYIHQDSSNNLQIHYSAGGGGGFSNNISLPSNQWSIIAVTQTTGGLVTYYLNGQAVGTNTGVTFAQYVNSGNTENVAFTDNYWYGDIGVTAVYGSALSASQIQSNYTTLAAQYGMVTNNLVAYYNPDLTTSYPGTGTTLFDISGNGLNGTMSNITYTDPYLTYNGTNATTSIADNALLEPGSGDFTLEAWVYYSTITGSTRTFVSKTDNGGLASSWSYGLRTQPNGAIGETYLEVGNGTTSVSTPRYNVSTGQWYQIVGVWTNVASNSIELYVNGASQGSNSHAFASVKNSTNPLYLGSYNGGEYSQWLNGRMGIVRYYNAALTAAQVLQNYNANRGVYGL